MHSERVRGATRLAAGRVPTIMEIRRQGRWKSDACIMHKSDKKRGGGQDFKRPSI